MDVGVVVQVLGEVDEVLYVVVGQQLFVRSGLRRLRLAGDSLVGVCGVSEVWGLGVAGRGRNVPGLVRRGGVRLLGDGDLGEGHAGLAVLNSLFEVGEPVAVLAEDGFDGWAG